MKNTLPKKDDPADCRHILYTPHDGVPRFFSPFTLADLKRHSEILIDLSFNDVWLFMSIQEARREEPPADSKKTAAAPSSAPTHKSLTDFLKLIFSPKYCDPPLTKSAEIENAVDTTDIRHLLHIATGIGSRVKEEKRQTTALPSA